MTTSISDQDLAARANRAGREPDGRRLSELDDSQRYAAYDRLQQSMADVWSAIRQDHDDESVVVVPSVSLDRTTATSGTLVQAMEERALFQLLLLRQPRLRMVYVTSQPVPESVVEYYLGLLPGVIISHARARLTMISVGDAGLEPLSAKLLARPRLLREIRDLVSGSGNALVDLRDLPEPGAADEAARIEDRVYGMALEDPTIAIDTYLTDFVAGGIVEERISGVALTSPSVQLRAFADGSVELLSTHDQLLGGASGQRYLGCVFPADPAYAAAIAEPAMIIGRHLAGLGVIGRFAVDFVTVRAADGRWIPYAIELNLRKGGTTHPFLTLQFLTDGSYDGERGMFETASGAPKHLVATDHLEDDRLKALTVDDLFDIVARHRLHYDAARQTGVVFHMFSCLTEHGRLGFTAVGDTAEEARQIYETAQQVLLSEAERAVTEGPVIRTGRI